MKSWNRVAIAIAVWGLAACTPHDMHSSDAADVSSSDTHDWHDASDARLDIDDAASPPDAIDASPPDAPSTVDGAHCSSAIPLIAGATLTAHTASIGDPSTQCRPSDAPQRFYSFVLPAHQRATLVATPTGGTPWSLVLRVLTSCTATECLTDAQSTGPGAPVTLHIDSPGDTDLVKTVTVSGLSADAGGDYTLALRLDPIGSGGPSCAAPVARALVPAADSVIDVLDGAPVVPDTSCSRGAGSQRIYSLHVTDATHAFASVECASGYCSVAIRRACDDPASEVACAVRVEGPSRSAELDATLTPGDYFVIVAADSVASVPFTMTFATSAGLAPNAFCDHPTPIVSGVVMHEDLSRAGPLNTICGDDPENDFLGHPLYYSVTLRPGETLVLTQPTFGVMAAIAPASCTTGVCIDGVDTHTDQVLRNSRSTSLDVLVMLVNGAFAPTSPNPTDVSFDILPPDANSTCATATALADGARLTNLRPVLGGTDSPCGSSTDPTLYYSVTIPPLSRLDALLTPRGHDYFFAPMFINVLDGCGSAGTCPSLVASNGRDSPLPVSATNQTTSPRTVILAISGSSNHADLAIDIHPFVPGPAPANATCASATPVASGDFRFDGPAFGFVPGATCLVPAAGRLLYYSISIPAGQTLQAWVQPPSPASGIRRDGTIGTDLSLRLADSCAATACLATVNASPGNDLESLSFANPDATARDVVLAVADADQYTVGIALVPTSAPTGHVAGIATGSFSTCARMDDGTVRCANSGIPTTVAGLSNVAGLALGLAHTCALATDGSVQCAGSNGLGQLGDGTTTSRDAFAPVPGLTDIAQVVAGEAHTCARSNDGTVRCWGSNASFQVGPSATDPCGFGPICALGPVLVPGLSSVVEIAAGSFHTCARRNDGTVLCWGQNWHGALGDGTIESRGMPQVVPGISNAVQLSLGDGHTCARLADGTVRCWGDDQYGQLGFAALDNSCSYPGPCARVPTAVPGVSGILEVAAGGAHTCARRADGALLCWGSNQFGQLGDGTTATRTGPAMVVGASGTTGIALGRFHSCALRMDRSVMCWGRSGGGVLGDGTVFDRLFPVVTLF